MNLTYAIDNEEAEGRKKLKNYKKYFTNASLLFETYREKLSWNSQTTKLTWIFLQNNISIVKTFKSFKKFKLKTSMHIFQFFILFFYSLQNSQLHCGWLKCAFQITQLRTTQWNSNVTMTWRMKNFIPSSGTRMDMNFTDTYRETIRRQLFSPRTELQSM